MSFWIQVGNPVVLERQGALYDDLSWAIEEIFPMSTEEAFMVWNGIYLPLDYRYILPEVLTDALYALPKLLGPAGGSHRLCFGDNEFNAEWLMNWDDDTLHVSAKWDSIGGGLKDIINAHPNLTISRLEFLSEWKGLLEQVDNAIRKSGVIFEDESEIELLRTLVKSIPEYGRLYRYRDKDQLPWRV